MQSAVIVLKSCHASRIKNSNFLNKVAQTIIFSSSQTLDEQLILYLSYFNLTIDIYTSTFQVNSLHQSCSLFNSSCSLTFDTSIHFSKSPRSALNMIQISSIAILLHGVFLYMCCLKVTTMFIKGPC